MFAYVAAKQENGCRKLVFRKTALENLSVSIRNVKNISSADIEFPLENSLNLIVGSNGSGKSTIIQALSQAISKYPLKRLQGGDFDKTSMVKISLGEKIDEWQGSNDWYLNKVTINLNGMYEGSLFYGTRFNDSRVVDELDRDGKIPDSDVVDADDYVKEKMSFILHGVVGKYPNLKRIKNRQVSEKLMLESTPYFNRVNGHLISQYRMSSGECLLISLLHFVYNAIVRRSLPQNELILVLIDEIEVALHPIAVSRFLDLMSDLIAQSKNLMIILSSHSPEVIRKIHPKNIYKIENNSGVVGVVNPCYPSYVIRDIYKHDGFDYLLLVEDDLAKVVVDKVIELKVLKSSKLIHVVPVGGWSNVLVLQKDLLQNYILGLGREIISIIDGDVKNEIPNEYDSLKKMFLPIKSIEKFLYDVLIVSPNQKIKKTINDKYFPIESIDELISQHHTNYPGKVDHPDKKFYFRLRKNLESRGIDELMFVHKLSDDIMSEISFEKFSEGIEKVLARGRGH